MLTSSKYNFIKIIAKNKRRSNIMRFGWRDCDSWALHSFYRQYFPLRKTYIAALPIKQCRTNERKQKLTKAKNLEIVYSFYTGIYRFRFISEKNKNMWKKNRSEEKLWDRVGNKLTVYEFTKKKKLNQNHQKRVSHGVRTGEMKSEWANN